MDLCISCGGNPASLVIHCKRQSQTSRPHTLEDLLHEHTFNDLVLEDNPFQVSLSNWLSLQTLQLTKQSKLSYTSCANYFKQHLCVKCLLNRFCLEKEKNLQSYN